MFFYIYSGIPEAFFFLHRFWDTRGLHVFYIYSGIPEAYMFFT